MPPPKAYVSPSCRLSPGPVSSPRVSTFPKRFEPLRDQLVKRAKETPDFLESVFTLNDVPSDDEIIQSIENRLWTLLHRYPFWFGLTKSADAGLRAQRRRNLIERGLIIANAEPAGLAARRKRLAAMVYEDVEGKVLDAIEAATA